MNLTEYQYLMKAFTNVMNIYINIHTMTNSSTDNYQNWASGEHQRKHNDTKTHTSVQTNILPLSYMPPQSCNNINYRPKLWNFFYFIDFFCIFVGCAECFRTWNTFLQADITFGGVNKYLTAKWSANVQKQLFRYFFQLDYGYNCCFPIIRLLPYPFECCIVILCTIQLFI